MGGGRYPIIFLLNNQKNKYTNTMLHALKTIQPSFEELQNGYKTFELRKDDRPFEKGDHLVLQEWDDENKRYTGKELFFLITYVLKNVPKYGLKDGYVILGITEKVNTTRES